MRPEALHHSVHALMLARLLSATLFPPQPNKLTNTVALSSNLKTAAKTIIAEIGTNFYRADLQSAALAKASALCKAAKKSK